MVTLNLLRAEHGLRKKFLRHTERKRRWRLNAAWLFTGGVILLLLYMGLDFIGTRVLSFLNAMDEHYEELPDVSYLREPAGRDIKIPDWDLHNNFTGDDKSVNIVNRDAKKEKENNKENKKEKKPDVSGTLREIRVATIIIRSNAEVLEKRLKKNGFFASIKAGTAAMPFRRLRYSGMPDKETKKVLEVFRQHSIDYTSGKKNGGAFVFSEKIFIPATWNAVTSELKRSGISGTQKRGRSGVKVFRVLLDGVFSKEDADQKISMLASHGFSPVAVTLN